MDSGNLFPPAGLFPVLPRGGEHHLDVLCGDILLYVMDLVEDIAPAAGTERSDVPPYILTHILEATPREHALRVTPPSPEDDAAAELLHQFHGLHAGRGYLYGIKYIDTRVYPVADIAAH